MDSSLFETELLKAFATLKSLHSIKVDTVLKKGEMLEADIISGPNPISIKVRLLEDLRILKETKSDSILANTKVKLTIEENGATKIIAKAKDSLEELSKIRGTE